MNLRHLRWLLIGHTATAVSKKTIVSIALCLPNSLTGRFLAPLTCPLCQPGVTIIGLLHIRSRVNGSIHRYAFHALPH